MTALRKEIAQISNHPYLSIVPDVKSNVSLKKDGTPKIICQNKQRGRKSEVYPFEIEDMKNIIAYYESSNNWLHYLLFVLSCNMARRINDMLSLKWYHLYNPKTGNLRDNILEIQEDKTDKLANPRINSACKSAIEKYIEKTNCEPFKNNYSEYVFLQISGTHKGSVLSDSGFLKSLKKAAETVGIEYNVGTHSCRKTFGKMCRMLHPNDYDSMELLQTIYNHADTKTTKHYIGLTKSKVDSYYDDMGAFFDDYISGDMEYQSVSENPVVSLDINDLRDIVRSAYEAGKNNAGEADVMVHIDSVNAIMQMIDNLRK